MIGQFAVRNFPYGPKNKANNVARFLSFRRCYFLCRENLKMDEESFIRYVEQFHHDHPDSQSSESDSFPNFEGEFLEKENKLEEEEADNERDSSQELDDFIKAEKAKNTVKKTALDWKKIETYCQEKTNSKFNIQTIPVSELDKLLATFFKDIRKRNGDEYEPDTISSYQKSIQRHVGELKLPLNILKDDAFSRSREVLSSKRKNLVKQGLGNKPNACRELTEEDVNKLFEAKVFGNHDPVSLQRTIWWFLSMHFGFRARDESRKLCWGDVVLEVDPDTNREVLVWTAERGSKTRQGLEGGHRRPFNPRVFATGTERCPILYYKLFRGYRPERANSPDSPFFLAVNHKKRDSLVWYNALRSARMKLESF